MTDFVPQPGMRLWIGPQCYQFVPHPLLPPYMEEVYVIEGGEALIYQVQDLSAGSFWALKVTKPAYRGEHIARASETLAAYASIPGLAVGRRLCLTKASAPQVIATFPELEYAIVMPWIQGRTWAGFIQDRAASASYSPSQALSLAQAAAQVMWDLEAHHLAHGDIAGGNIAISPDFRRVELLDIEGLYIPGAPQPKWHSQGSPGYQHRNLGPQGQWRPEGDRFAGAVLLTEMLALCDPRVRAQIPPNAEALFQPHELQVVGSPLWQATRDALWTVCPPALPLFDQAWASSGLAECPELSTWALCLIQIASRGGS